MQNSRSITRKSGSNLALAFILLPPARRDAMSALYAFCREVDDVADEDSLPVEKRREGLAAWREDLRTACQPDGHPTIPVNRELQPFIAQYQLRFEYFDELIQGMEMDLDTHRYKTFVDLEHYCYRAASVVGLLSIEIFGYRDPACRDYAVHLGKALQLTNILRDVRNDADRGRIYLPLDEMARFGVTEREIIESRYSDRFAALAGAVAQRARHFYALARQTLPDGDRRSMATAELMASVYGEILQKLEAQRFNVFGPKPAKLGKGRKLFLILNAWLRQCHGK